MATARSSPATSPGTCARYRARNPRATALYPLLESFYDTLKAVWEERFEKRYGYWRGLCDRVVARYLDCGLFENGFARVKCTRCPTEFLVAFSCKTRGLCPSCGAKRAALFAEQLQHEILADVPHAQWVFSIPKMLRPYFLHHRELLSDLARLAYQTVHEMMAAALDEPTARPGMLTVLQSFGASLRWNPHIHAIVTRGVWDAQGQWHPLPYVDEHKAELLFRHKVLRLLRDKDLLSQERIELLLSWKHSGFAVHNRTTVYPQDREGLHRLACYLMRSPVNLSRLRFAPESNQVLYQTKPGHDRADSELMDPLEFLARVLIHIPQPNKHLVHYFGAYANRVRSTIQQGESQAEPDKASPKPRALRKRWAELIYRIYEVDPLSCPNCGSEMKILAFITHQPVIRRILNHLDTKASAARAPPQHSITQTH